MHDIPHSVRMCQRVQPCRQQEVGDTAVSSCHMLGMLAFVAQLGCTRGIIDIELALGCLWMCVLRLCARRWAERIFVWIVEAMKKSEACTYAIARNLVGPVCPIEEPDEATWNWLCHPGLVQGAQHRKEAATFRCFTWQWQVLFHIISQSQDSDLANLSALVLFSPCYWNTLAGVTCAEVHFRRLMKAWACQYGWVFLRVGHC